MEPNFDPLVGFSSKQPLFELNPANATFRIRKNQLRSFEYIETIQKITSLDTDISSFQVRNATKMLLTDNPNNWIEFDFALSDITSQKKKKSLMYVVISILLGGMVGSVYVLISNAIRNSKKQLAEV